MKKVVELGAGAGDYVVTLEYHEHQDPFRVTFVNWYLRRIWGVEADTNRRVYQNADNNITYELEEAEVEVEGFCKWDGCCEIKSDTHICAAHDLLDLLSALQRVYTLCAEITDSDALKDCKSIGWTT